MIDVYACTALGSVKGVFEQTYTHHAYNESLGDISHVFPMKMKKAQRHQNNPVFRFETH